MEQQELLHELVRTVLRFFYEDRHVVLVEFLLHERVYPLVGHGASLTHHGVGCPTRSWRTVSGWSCGRSTGWRPGSGRTGS
jgi:hypothetical protein